MSKPTLKPHLYREMVNNLREIASKQNGRQSLREQIAACVRKYIESENGKERNKSS